MKAFDPGGGAATQTTPSAQFSLVQFCARGEFFRSKGLKEGIFLEDAEKRVLHSTCRATWYLIAGIAQAKPFQDPSKRTHFSPVLENVEQFIDSKDQTRTSNGSFRSPHNVAGGMAERGCIGVDALCKGHNKVKTCGDVQQKKENFIQVAGSCYGSSPSSSHPEVSVLLSSKPLPNIHDSARVSFTSSQAVDIPIAMTIHISCEDVRNPCSANESCIEEPEGPSTPDLQAEGRSCDCDVLCAKDADDMLLADNLLMEQEDVMSTCMLQCQIGPTKWLDALIQDDEDACEDDSSLPGKSFTLSDYWEGVNRRYALRKSNSTASRRNIRSSLGICAAPGKKKSHLRVLYSLQFRLAQQHIKLLEGKKGEEMCEQLLAEIQLYLQVYKPKLIHDRGEKETEVSTAVCDSSTLVCNKVRSVDKVYAGRNGHHKKEMILQEQVLDMLQAFYSKYVSGNSGSRLPLACPFLLEHDNYEAKHYSSASSSKMGIDTASKLPDSLVVNDEGLPRSTKSLSMVMDNFKEDASHGPPFVKKVDDWNSIPIDQVDKCLDTCLSHLQLRRSSEHALRTKETFQEGNKYEASCLPASAVDKPHNHTQSQCISRLSLNREERQSKEKLEHFAEGFLLRRHIIQQQRRAQKSPPFPPGDSVRSAVNDNSTSRRLLDEVRTNPYAVASMQASIKYPEVKNHGPTMILTSSLTKPCTVASSFCDGDGCIGADCVIDIVGLLKYIENHSRQSETFTDVAANSINCIHMPQTGGQLVIPSVGAVVVTIVAIVVYTKVLLEGALAWVGARTQSREED